MFQWHFHPIIALPIDVAINGFNGLLFKEECSSIYRWNIANLGTKWDVVEAYPIKLTDHSVWIEFDSAWSPAIPVSEMLSKYYQCDIEHIYAEQGCNFCGFVEFSDGVEVSPSLSDDIEHSANDEDGWSEVIGPDYILELGHFGG